MNKDKISLKNISTSLGVSNTLVSLVLNNKGDLHGISKETQKLVFDKAKELDYKPSFLARGLRTGRSYTLGLIVSDISNPFYSKMVRYMEDEAEKNNFTFLIGSTDESNARENKILKMLIDRQVDGIIISSSQSNPEFINELKNRKIPYVLIDRFFQNQTDVNSVSVDNIRGTYKAIEHLVMNGYKNIAMFAITPIYISSIRERIDGYLRSIKAFGFNYGSELLFELDYYNINQNVQNAIYSNLNHSENPIDAIFAINNNVAISCLKVINEMRIKMPEQLGFICFDDIDLFELTNPRISAISQPIQAIAETAVQKIIELINNQNIEPSQIVLQTNLVVRDSSQKLSVNV